MENLPPMSAWIILILLTAVPVSLSKGQGLRNPAGTCGDVLTPAGPQSFAAGIVLAITNGISVVHIFALFDKAQEVTR